MFSILKISIIMPFCNLFMGRFSYIRQYVVTCLLFFFCWWNFKIWCQSCRSLVDSYIHGTLCMYLRKMFTLLTVSLCSDVCVCQLWTCLMLSGMDSQTVPIYAEANWLRCSCRGHSYSSAAQQSLAAWEAHHIVRDWDICRSCPHQTRTTVVMYPIATFDTYLSCSYLLNLLVNSCQ